MATSTIKWNEGDGNIVATYEGSGDGPISIISDVANEGIDREQTIQVKTANNAKSIDVIVKQEGLREKYITADGEVYMTADNEIYGVLKGVNEPESITVQYKGYYPELVDSLISQYGEKYGSKMSPLPFNGNIILTGSPNELGNGKVEYISTGEIGTKFCILLYTANYTQTWVCAYLSDNGSYKGYCGTIAL